jgi:hypothetical protein
MIKFLRGVLHAVPLRQTDVVAGLLLHPGQDLLFRRSQIE